MNREAVALGTPVYTTFEGRPGALDEQLIASGRLRRLRDPAEIEIRKQPPHAGRDRIRRDPRVLLDMLLSPPTR
jgi:uncharacterized protein